MRVFKKRYSWTALWIFLLGMMVFTIGLGQQELIGFETRFYFFALEMWRHGFSFFPTTYQEPYPDYPVTSTAMIYFFSKAVGGLTKWSAVFPSAVAAAVTLAVTYLIGALRNRYWGFYAVCFLLFTEAFLGQARTISLDQYTTAVTTLCFYLAYSASIFHTTQRLYWIPLLFVVGFAFRGPIGLIVPAGVLCVTYLLDRNIKLFFIMGLLATLLLIVCCFILLGLANHVGGVSFAEQVFYMEVIGRMHSVAAPPFFFYFSQCMAIYAVPYVLAIFVLLGIGSSLFKVEEEREDIQLIRKLLGWVLVILIGLSIPQDKKIRYVLAIAPALALVCAYLFAVPQQKKYFILLRYLFLGVCFVFPASCLVILLLAMHKAKDFLSVAALSEMIIFFLVLQVGIVVGYVGLRKKVHRREAFVVIMAVGSFVGANILIAEPIDLALNQVRSVVEKIEKQREQQHRALVFYHTGRDGVAIKYVANMPHEVNPIFIDTVGELVHFSKRALFVTDSDYYQALPHNIQRRFAVMAQYKLGGHEMVFFVRA